MTAYRVENGVIVAKQAPGRTAAALGAGWIDGPDDWICGYIASGDTFVPPPGPTAAEILAEKRAKAVLSRAQFIQAVHAAGILNKAQAVEAAAGGIPAFFINALNALVAAQAMTQAQADGAEILWAGLTQVERNHPFLPIAQGALGLTEAQVDALFGIA